MSGNLHHVFKIFEKNNLILNSILELLQLYTSKLAYKIENTRRNLESNRKNRKNQSKLEKFLNFRTPIQEPS